MSIVALPTTVAATPPTPRMPADAVTGFAGLLAHLAHPGAGPAVVDAPAPLAVAPPARPAADAGRVTTTVEALVAAAVDAAPSGDVDLAALSPIETTAAWQAGSNRSG